MTPIIQKYIRNEILPPFLIALSIFSAMLLMGSAMEMSTMIIAKGVAFHDILAMILYGLPSILWIAIPMAFLMASLTAMGRLSADSEIIAMRSLGMGTTHFVTPVLKLGIIFFLFTFCIGAFAVPWGTSSTNQLLFHLLREHATAGIKTKTFNDQFTDLVLYAEEVSKDGRTIRKLMISDYRSEKPEIIVAGRGEIQTDSTTFVNTLTLNDGSIHAYDARQNRYRLIHFDHYKLALTTDRESEEQRSLISDKSPADMSLQELREAARHAPPAGTAHYLMRYHEKIALPFSCVIFGLFSIPLGIRFKRSGKVIGFTWSLIVIFLYYILLGIGRNFGSEGLMTPAVAAWLPNIVFGILAVFFLFQSSRRVSA